MKFHNSLGTKDRVIFDLEIKKPIEECSRGWQSHDEMGISCAVIYELAFDRFIVFDEHTLDGLQNRLNSADVIIGFNHIHFDYNVMKHSGYPIISRTTNPDIGPVDFDILRQTWLAAGLGVEYVHKTHGGFGLDACVKGTLNKSGKTGHGADAPLLWRAGRWGELVSYCINDVKLTRDLYLFIFEHKYIIVPGKGLFRFSQVP